MNDYRAKVVKNNVPHLCFLQNFKRLYKRYLKEPANTGVCRLFEVGLEGGSNAEKIIRAGWRGARVAG